jgi:aerobic-type carbon monoxide dehydrogenase small subunit (CoxS/CutS family)
MRLNINGQLYEVKAPHEEMLLWVLRDELGLTGTKPGCEVGACGVCIVIIDGQPATACNTSLKAIEGCYSLLTVEGLSDDNNRNPEWHPVQQAFLQEQVPQCGWCTAGQLLSSVVLLQTYPIPTLEQIEAALDRVYCRCGNYNRLKTAIGRAVALLSEQTLNDPPTTHHHP